MGKGTEDDLLRREIRVIEPKGGQQPMKTIVAIDPGVSGGIAISAFGKQSVIRCRRRRGTGWISSRA